MHRQARSVWNALLAFVIAGAFASTAHAQEIVVSNYGVSANGMPFAVALEKGYFKDEGINVTGIITSAGGGTTLRNMLAGNAPYGEVNPVVVVSAVLQGADLRIISDNVSTVAEFVWAVKPDSPIKTVKDLKGKKFGYTNPRSTSQALANLILQSAGLKPDQDVELVKTGGFGEGVAALDKGLVDIVPIPEPLWSKYKDKYRAVVVASEALPPLGNVVGVTTVEGAAKNGKFISAVIRARRKAVQFMKTNPDEAADIIAKVYNIERDVSRSAVRNLTKSTTNGVPYWSEGQVNLSGLKRMIDAQKEVGAITGDVDLTKIIDTRFLPDDLKAIK
jgi:NitT/TauT family transport system substrate-binding protein